MKGFIIVTLILTSLQTSAFSPVPHHPKECMDILKLSSEQRRLVKESLDAEKKEVERIVKSAKPQFEALNALLTSETSSREEVQAAEGALFEKISVLPELHKKGLLGFSSIF